MFKIVEILENGRAELKIVPANWENGQGTLFWPRKFACKLQKEGDSTPKPNWLRRPCKLKKKCLSSYKIAEEELNRMLQGNDEHEPSVFGEHKRRRILLPKKASTKSTNVHVSDFLGLASSCAVDNNDNDPEVVASSGGSYEKREQSSQTYNVTNPGQPIQMESSTPQIIPTQTAVATDDNKLDTIIATLNNVVENQYKIMKDFATFQVAFETDVQERNASVVKSRHISRATISPFEPIDCLEDLKEFNEKLKDNEIFNEYVDCLSLICGKDTETKGIDHCYMLVDKFFTRKFFTLCSWAGGAKAPNTKFPFKFYENVIGLFFKLVNLADPGFTLEDCEDFFKGVIRNCVRRNNSSNIRTSRSKKRPKNLSYNIKTYESEIDADASVSDNKEDPIKIENIEYYDELPDNRDQKELS